MMLIQSSPLSLRGFATLAVLLSNVASTAFACSFSQTFPDGLTIDESGTETFNVAPNAVTTCDVSCSFGAGSFLYLRYGGSANLVFNDGSEESAIGCDMTLPIVSNSEEYELGWQLIVLSPYTGLSISCTCTQAGDGDDRWNGCFSESAQVEVEDKGVIAMKDLNVGDKVLADNGKYQSVYSFGHYHETMEHDFLQIYTQKNDKTPLEMTGDHMIFAVQNGQQQSVRADSLKEGDQLVHATSHQTTTVTKISSVRKQGVYMPLTTDGTIVVNGLKASAYVSVLEEETPSCFALKSHFGIDSEHTIYQWWLSPLRMLCMGVSSKFCTENAHTEEGILKWLLVGRDVTHFAEQQHWVVQVVAFAAPAFVVFSIFNLVEFLLGAALAPSLVGLAVGLALFYRQANKERAGVSAKKIA